jgi:hypothetical protein
MASDQQKLLILESHMSPFLVVSDDGDREVVLKILVFFDHLMQLLVQGDFIEYGRCESFKL